MKWTMKTDPAGFQTRWSEELAQRWFAEGHWRRETLTHAARAAVKADPGHAMLIEGERVVTRGEVWDQSLRLAGFFLRRGLNPGDVISFQLPNWIEAAVIALAARMCGLVINPIPPIYREAETAHILKDCGARMIFVPGLFRKHDHRAMIEQLRSQLPALQDIVTVRAESALDWDTVTGGDPADEAALPEVDPGATIIAMYTSGTTGRPKCVLHTHLTYGHRVRVMSEAYGMSRGRRDFHALARHPHHRRDLGVRHAVDRRQLLRSHGRVVARGRHRLHRGKWLHRLRRGNPVSPANPRRGRVRSRAPRQLAAVLLRRHHRRPGADRARRRDDAAGVLLPRLWLDRMPHRHPRPHPPRGRPFRRRDRRPDRLSGRNADRRWR